MSTIEARPVAIGAAVALAVALPVGLVGQFVVDDTSGSLEAAAFLVPILVAFAAGGFVAARRAATSPLTNGALAAVAAYALIQGVGVLRRLVTGEGVNLASLAFAAFLAYSCGLVGALVAGRGGGSESVGADHTY